MDCLAPMPALDRAPVRLLRSGTSRRTASTALHYLVPLSVGRCHFRLDGPRHGRLVLLIHGATVPGWEFDRLVPYLHAAGFRTLAPDLYGHGFSARPRVRYDYRLFEDQLCELLRVLYVEQPFDVIGHSMGAALAARLARRLPRQVGRLVLTAPLLDFEQVQVWTRLLALPLLGELLMPLLVKPMLMRRRRRRYQPIEDGRWVELFRHQLAIPGFGAMLLSMLRSGTLGDQGAAYRDLVHFPGELMLLRGERDTILPRAQFERLRALMPRARCVELRDSAHAAVITDPGRVASPVIDFLCADDDAHGDENCRESSDS